MKSLLIFCLICTSIVFYSFKGGKDCEHSFDIKSDHPIDIVYLGDTTHMECGNVLFINRCDTIRADTMILSETEPHFYFKGHVKVSTGGNNTFECNELTINKWNPPTKKQ